MNHGATLQARLSTQNHTMAKTDHLLIPEAAHHDDNSFELIRVWIADHRQHVILRGGVWDDPALWGMMLADLAGHIANTFERGSEVNRSETLRRIRAGFDAEMDSPTDQPKGTLLE